MSKSSNWAALLHADGRSPWHLFIGCFSLGIIVGQLFAHSLSGLTGLVPRSLALAWFLLREGPSGFRQLGGALCYSSGVVLCSAKFAEILEFIRHGQLTVALRELPELIICVALPILVAFALIALVRLVLGEPTPQHKKTI